MKPINRNRRAVQTLRRALRDRVADFLATQADAMAQQITDAIASETQKVAKGEEMDPDIVGRILHLITFDDWATLVPDLESALLEVLLKGADAAFAQLAVEALPAMTEQVHELALAWAEARAAELVGLRRLANGTLVPNPDARWVITESTREALRTDVVTALEEGWSNQRLARALSDAYAFSEERADVIARTETGNADVAGSLQAYIASGEVAGKRVLLGSEHDPADVDECVEAAAMGVVPLDSDFDGRGNPLFHPRCVCDLEPVLADD